MNLLGFLAIVITVTGLVWLLQVLLNGKDRIDINVSVGRKPSSGTISSSSTSLKTGTEKTESTSSDSILGDVLQPATRVIDTERKNSAESVEQPDSAVGIVRETDAPRQDSLLNQVASGNNINSIIPADNKLSSEDEYIDTVLKDANFVDITDVSSLEEVDPSQLAPQIGQLTYSCFGSIVEQMPPGSFDKPQSPQHIEAMFELLRESTQRIEQQMIALNALQHSLFSLATQQKERSATNTTDNHSRTEESGQSETTEYSFGDDDGLEESAFGGGLAAQLDIVYPEGESQSAQATEYFTASEAGVEMPEDAMQSFDLDEISEPIIEVRQPILNYLAGLNQTGELSHEVVAAIQRKAPTREVKHRVRQVLRAIDHYNFSSDANALLRITAVFQNLPRDLKNNDPIVASIGRKFGILEPSDEPVSVEDDDQ